MNKKEILQQWFKDIENDENYFYFSVDGKALQISGYTLGNLILNASREALKSEILQRAENQFKYYLHHSDLRPTINLFRMRPIKFNDGTAGTATNRFSWDFENWGGGVGDETRKILVDPEKLQEFAKEITKAEADQIIRDVLYSEKIQDQDSN